MLARSPRDSLIVSPSTIKSSVMAVHNNTTTDPYSIYPPDDVRFFHHFLLNACPPLPILGGHIWREVAALSHNHRNPNPGRLDHAPQHCPAKVPRPVPHQRQVAQAGRREAVQHHRHDGERERGLVRPDRLA
ncbi:hypothetical protein VTK26DRAFT_2514 [Humicola hyalothermophila]